MKMGIGPCSGRRHIGIQVLLILLAGSSLFFPQDVSAENRCPIILIHGFMGWGPEEMGNYRYWGGQQDLETYLESLGYEVIVVSVGPVSSNWDRAVEVYSQLKGGQVDYGKAHARKWSLIQKPEELVYKGLYPEWDSDHPVHLIGHSMGGQTARMLQVLLTTVFYEDSAGTIVEESELLGESHRGWIHSITTLSTPHNGTTLSDIVTRSVPFLQYFIGLAGVVGNDFYNFDLRQWDFKRQENESWTSYYRRLREHPAWKTRNISAWDVSLEGARELNTLASADPDIYYFSHVTSTSRYDSTSGRHIPVEGTNLILHAKTLLIGSQIAYWADGTATDSTWFENDGVVNTISQYGPTTGMNGPDPIAEYKPSEPLIPGQWYFFGPHLMDHWRIVGHFNLTDEERKPILDLFRDHCQLLWSLPE